jgi:hypothetical protein
MSMRRTSGTGRNANLRGGAGRLVFAADVIPDELATVIEFLNTRMRGTEVYGGQVRRHGSGGAAECFVPRLIGGTAAAQAQKRRQALLDEKLRNAGLTSSPRPGVPDSSPKRSAWRSDPPWQASRSPTHSAAPYGSAPPAGRPSSR